MKHAHVRFALAVILPLVCAEAARACTCGYPSPGEAFAGAGAVFIGTVRRTAPEGSTREHDGEQTARVRVEEAFKGARAGQVFALQQPGGMCTPKFTEGDRLLFFASFDRKSKSWTVYGCNRTRLVEEAADELLFLRALPGSARRTRLSGVVKHFEDGPDHRLQLVKYVAGMKVRVVGAAETFEVTTNGDGVYELYDLPPGTYRIEPEPPRGLAVRFPMPFGPSHREEEGGAVTVELAAATTAGADFVLRSDNSAAGRVLGPDGRPLAGIRLALPFAPCPPLPQKEPN